LIKRLFIPNGIIKQSEEQENMRKIGKYAARIKEKSLPSGS
jgi:hypothetical protein